MGTLADLDEKGFHKEIDVNPSCDAQSHLPEMSSLLSKSLAMIKRGFIDLGSIDPPHGLWISSEYCMEPR